MAKTRINKKENKDNNNSVGEDCNTSPTNQRTTTVDVAAALSTAPVARVEIVGGVETTAHSTAQSTTSSRTKLRNTARTSSTNTTSGSVVPEATEGEKIASRTNLTKRTRSRDVELPIKRGRISESNPSRQDVDASEKRKKTSQNRKQTRQERSDALYPPGSFVSSPIAETRKSKNKINNEVDETVLPDSTQLNQDIPTQSNEIPPSTITTYQNTLLSDNMMLTPEKTTNEQRSRTSVYSETTSVDNNYEHNACNLDQMSLAELDLSMKSDGNFSDHLESPLVQLNQQKQVHIQARSFDDKEEKRTRTLNEQQEHSKQNINDNNTPGESIEIETPSVMNEAQVAAKKALFESTFSNPDRNNNCNETESNFEEKQTLTFNEQQEYSKQNINDNNTLGESIENHDSLVKKAARIAATKAVFESTLSNPDSNNNCNETKSNQNLLDNEKEATIPMSETNNNDENDDSDTSLNHQVDISNLNETDDTSEKKVLSVGDDRIVDTENSFSQVEEKVDRAIKPKQIVRSKLLEVIYDEKQAKHTRLLIVQFVKQSMDEKNIRLSFRISSSLPDEASINKVCQQLFNTNEPDIASLFSLARFLETAYLHDNKYPLLNLFDITKSNDEIIVDSEVLNIMLILLVPQQIEQEDAITAIPTESVDETNKQMNCMFDYENLRLKMSKDPSKEFPLQGPVSDECDDGLKEIIRNQWIAFQQSCNLPFMIFSQPLAFELKYEKRTGKVYVYIYLSLLPNINSRRLTSDNERLNHGTIKRGILTNMTTANLSIEEFKIDSTQIIIHPIQINEVLDSDADVTKELDLRSPLSDNAPSTRQDGNTTIVGNDLFAKGKFVAKVPDNHESLSDSICKIFGKRNMEAIFSKLPDSTEVDNMGNFCYCVVLYINFYKALNSHYNDFKHLKSYIRLFDNLNQYMIDEKKHVSVKLSRHHITQNNVFYICRLMFRYFCGSLGLMIPEGNGRNYAACLAFARCKSALINKYLNKQIPSKECLPEPNLEYISRHIGCDYVLHKHDENIISNFPYDNNKSIYIKLSQRSYMDSHSSQVMTCRDFADRFFTMFIDKNSGSSESIEELLPYEIKEEWPKKFKQLCEDFIKKEMDAKREVASKRRSKGGVGDKKPAKVEYDWTTFALTKWVSQRKALFLKEMFQRKDIMQLITPEYRMWTSKWTEEKIKNKLPPTGMEDDFLNHLIELHEANSMSELMTKTNIVRMMTLYLAGLICSAKDGPGQLIDCARMMVKTNGVISLVEKSNDLVCAWITRRDGEEKFPPIGTYQKYAGILPSKSNHSNSEMMNLFSKAFFGLYYCPTVFWSSVFSRLTYLYAGFNLSESGLCERGIFSAYRDVLMLYNTFGPIIPLGTTIKKRTNGSMSYKDFYDYMKMDIYIYPESEKLTTIVQDNETTPFFHYDPLKLDPGEHLSSNVPNFIVLIGFAIICNELNDLVTEKCNEPLFVPTPGKYLLKSNAVVKPNLFYKNNQGPKNHQPPYLILKKGKENKNFEKDFRLLRKKYWLKQPEEKCFLQDLQLKVRFAERAETKEQIALEERRAKWFTLQEIAKMAFFNVTNEDNKFYQLDDSFFKIIKYLQDPTNLKEFVRVPLYSLQNFIRRMDTKVAFIPKEAKIVFSKIFCNDALGEEERKEETEIQNMKKGRNTTVSSSGRPQALKFGSLERKLFKSALTVRLAAVNQKVVDGKESKSSTESDTVVMNSVNSMYDQATIHAEKFLECLALAHAGEKTKMEIKQRYLDLTNGYGDRVAYGKAATLLVAHAKQVLNSDKIFAALMEDHAFDLEDSEEDEEGEEEESEESEENSKEGTEIAKQAVVESKGSEKPVIEKVDLKSAEKSKKRESRPTDLEETIVSPRPKRRKQGQADADKAKYETFLKFAFTESSMYSKCFQELMKFNPGNFVDQVPWYIIEKAEQVTERKSVGSPNKMDIDVTKKGGEKLVTSKKSSDEGNGKDSCEEEKATSHEILDHVLAEVCHLAKKEENRELDEALTNLVFEVDLIYKIKTIEDARVFNTDDGTCNNIVEQYNEFVNEGRYYMQHFKFHQYEGVEYRRHVLKVFNTAEFEDDPIKELEVNGKKHGEFLYCFDLHTKIGASHHELIEKCAKCEKMAIEYNESQDEYVWTVTKVHQNFNSNIHSYFWVHSTCKEGGVSSITDDFFAMNYPNTENQIVENEKYLLEEIPRKKQEVAEIVPNYKLIGKVDEELDELVKNAVHRHSDKALTKKELEVDVKYIIKKETDMKDFMVDNESMSNIREAYNQFLDGGKFIMHHFVFGKDGRVKFRRQILKVFNSVENVYDPMKELEENGKKLGEFRYCFDKMVAGNDEKFDFMETWKKCDKMAHEFNESQDKYVWTCSRVKQSFDDPLYIYFWVQSSCKEGGNPLVLEDYFSTDYDDGVSMDV